MGFFNKKKKKEEEEKKQAEDEAARLVAAQEFKEDIERKKKKEEEEYERLRVEEEASRRAEFFDEPPESIEDYLVEMFAEKMKISKENVEDAFQRFTIVFKSADLKNRNESKKVSRESNIFKESLFHSLVSTRKMPGPTEFIAPLWIDSFELFLKMRNMFDRPDAGEEKLQYIFRTLTNSRDIKLDRSKIEKLYKTVSGLIENCPDLETVLDDKKIESDGVLKTDDILEYLDDDTTHELKTKKLKKTKQKKRIKESICSKLYKI
eukprot:320948_1